MEESSQVYAATDRLVIRHFSLEDVGIFYKYRSNPVIAQFQSWENYKYEDAELFVHKQINHKPDQPGTWFQFAIAFADSNELIGDEPLYYRMLFINESGG